MCWPTACRRNRSSTAPGEITSLTNTAAADGGTVTYSFVADHPGTYLYESGTDPRSRCDGPVRRADRAAHAGRRLRLQPGRQPVHTRPRSSWSCFPRSIPTSTRRSRGGTAFNLNNYHPRYWLINGRGFPDSIADNDASWLPEPALRRAGPQVNPLRCRTHPYPGLARYINVGTEDYPFHPHGNNGLVIGRDGHPLEGPAARTSPSRSSRSTSDPARPGTCSSSGTTPRTTAAANPVPVTCRRPGQPGDRHVLQRQPVPGQDGDLPPGASTLNQCGEYYIISHNHALFQITSWGANDDRPDHLHADRSARAQQLRE